MVLLGAGVRLRRAELALLGSALLAIASAKFAGHDLTAHFGFDARGLAFRPSYAAMLFERWTTSGLLLAASALLPLSLRRLPQIAALGGGEWRRFLWCLFTAELFLVLNLEVAACFHDVAPAARFAAISVLWTLFAIALLALGFARRAALLRHTAIALFALTAAKVVAVDMARARTPARIISFVVLGGVLIGASFLYHRLKERILARSGPPAAA
jgi:uncharacterized membrane protein